MMTAIPLGEFIKPDHQHVCRWPGCDDPVRERGLCDIHRRKVERGYEVGCENQWERLVMAALRFADAETEHEYGIAERQLRDAALTYRAAWGSKTKPVLVCSGPECGMPARAQGLCDSHYRQQKLGQPLTVIIRRRRNG